MPLAPGSRLGPYDILELIGRGGMGEVYRAVDSRLGRQVAIKVLPAHLADHEESLLRFRREARAVAALSHPNIVAVFDVGSQAETPYVVTELLEGETLRTRLARGKLSMPDALRIGGAIAEGLAAAHAKGIIHRDIKPENVFLSTDGSVKILDFGLASTQAPLAGSLTGMTQTNMLTEPGVMIGTVGYMSPEQLRAQSLTTASDVFSFGCVLYEMLRGDMPFRRDSNIEVVASVLRDEPFERDAADDLPSQLRDLLERCLQKEPRQRYQTGGEVAAALSSIDLGAKRVGQTLLSVRRSRRWLGALLIAAAVLVPLALFFASRDELLDDGFDLRASDVTGSAETRRFIALALRADAAGDRPQAIELLREASRLSPDVPLPNAFLSSFLYFSGHREEGLRWAAETQRKLPRASSTYENFLCRYLLPEMDSARMMALASSMLELRPNAWRLRLSLAHRHLDRREMPAMLAELSLIDVAAPDDRRLAVVLSDRASLGDIEGAARDLNRSRLVDRPALLAYTRARIAWARGDASAAARLYAEAAESATTTSLPAIAADARVLEGMAWIGAGDLERAQSTLDLAALKNRQAAFRENELEAHAFGAYVAWRRGDRDGMERRLRLAASLADPSTSSYATLRLAALRFRSSLTLPPAHPREDADSYAGLANLTAAREAWSRNDLAEASRLLATARGEGIDATWFAEEASLLAKDLGGTATRTFKPDPPYPNRLRMMAVWELGR